MGNAYMFESENLKERDFLEGLDIDVRKCIIIKKTVICRVNLFSNVWQP
jgi:hypothetical protein